MTTKPYALYAHQKLVLDKARHNSYGIFMECGTGKTLVGICLAKHYKSFPVRSGRTLVVAPLSLLFTAWADDLKKFAPELKASIAWGRTPKQREKALALATKADIAITSYEGFKKAGLWARQQNFDVLIIDESSKMKDPRTTISKMLTTFSRSVPRVYPMSGAPAPNNLLEIYPQADVIKPGLLGGNFYQCRAKFFAPHGLINGHAFDWRPLPGSTEAILEKLKPCASFIKKSDCLDLPEKVFVVRKFTLDPQTREAYDTMVRDKVLPLTDGQAVMSVNALAELSRCRQLASGWVYDHQGQAHGISDHKLDLLREVLDEIGPSPVIIWVQYREDARQLERALGDQAVLAIGNMTPGELTGNLDAFKASKVRYLIAHPRTIGHGVTLTNCSCVIYYSISYSLEEFLQSQDRVHRIGQTSKCTYFTLLAEDTVDEPIYKALTRKEESARAIVNYLREKTRKTKQHG